MRLDCSLSEQSTAKHVRLLYRCKLPEGRNAPTALSLDLVLKLLYCRTGEMSQQGPASMVAGWLGPVDSSPASCMLEAEGCLEAVSWAVVIE